MSVLEPSTPTLAEELRSRLRGEVRFDAGSRAAYATDSSNYRQPPQGVIVPADIDDAVTAIAVCATHEVSVTSRGGVTSLAGQTPATGWSPSSRRTGPAWWSRASRWTS